MIATRRPPCPVRAYAQAVVRGKVVAGNLVRLACARHIRDLKEGHTRGLVFDRGAADHAIEFFERFLRLPEGDRPFLLTPWQRFLIGSLFGWKGPDGFRRFRTAYVEGGKGCGKSPLAAGVGLYGLEADGELAPEVYASAVTLKQANIMFRDAQHIAQASPALQGRFDVGQHSISCSRTNGFFQPVSSEKRGLDGKRVHIGLIDELHEHPTSIVADKIRAGTKGRHQALIFEITNSGVDRTSVCWHHREYSEKVLQGIVDDDSWFAYVCTLDPCEKCAAEGRTQPTDGCPDCDDWRDERVWIKSCPNLDVSVTRKYLREQVHEAVGMPTKENIVKRLNFCIWTEADSHVIPMDRWDSCRRDIDLATLDGRTCYGGLDIGATSDFTAFVLMFPHDDAETVKIKDLADPESPEREIVRRTFTQRAWFWLPERPRKRDEKLQGVIDSWRRQGFIRTTPGEVVDYDQVLADVLEIVQPYRLAGIGFDRGFQGSQMGNNLMKHFGEMVEQVPQGIISMNAPFREYLELLIQGKLLHDGNPVLRWMASNTAADSRGGLMKPCKDKSTEKIDGVTAGVMGLALALRGGQVSGSYYETHDLEIL